MKNGLKNLLRGSIALVADFKSSAIIRTEEISIAKLIEKIIEMRAKGVSFSGITYFVDESLSKQVKGEKTLQKLVYANVTIGADYERKVNRILDKEGKESEFESGEFIGKMYPYGKEIPIATDQKTGTKNYLVMMMEHSSKPKVQHFHQNFPIDRAKAFEFLTPAGQTKWNEKSEGITGEGTQGGIEEEHKFYFRTLNMENIIAANIDHVQYVVVED